jgi:phosphomannomutase
MDLMVSAQAWLDQDPDPETRSELQELISNNELAGLAARFSSRLEFGTAGLRGELGAGPNRMNRVLVAQTALAIANFLKQNQSEYLDSNGSLSVVIGFDGRVNSDVFALDSAKIIAGAGINVSLFDSPVPTPVAAFSGRKLRSSATIVVTASHNPPKDNGYKVFLGGANGGSQLVSPQDSAIANQIDQVATNLTFAQIPQSNNFDVVGGHEIDAYIKRAAELIPVEDSKRKDLSITYTAMHGVGYRVIKDLLDLTGFKFQSVKKQQEPDGSFPTVTFPNPEEKGAMDLSFETASEFESDLILANDPDADRLAVGIRAASGYRMLTGDEVGLILADRMATLGKATVIANSLVSLDMSPLAKHYDLQYQQTLTGFKWISKVPNLSYGYEEALGYCVDPEFTPDKDGITAALMIADLASDLKAAGSNLGEYLVELAGRFGHQKTGQVSIRVTNLEIIKKIMVAVRQSPPADLIGEACESEDLALGVNFPATDGVILKSQNARVVIRPSGTEPKLKCYLQYTGPSELLAQEKLTELSTWASELLKKLS